MRISDWSSDVCSSDLHKQLIGRLRRPGMVDPVTAHYLHVNGGSDPVLMGMLGMKADQSRGILDPGKAAPARYTDESRVKMLAQYEIGRAPCRERVGQYV